MRKHKVCFNGLPLAQTEVWNQGLPYFKQYVW